ncbi:hypothetical protein [Kineosporia sp. NBRC 101731]|uniref:hypothetical protein n=1 Tax=Kineosporia sp. NBRC 101731 TaxID=3032199 RepID=UPI0025541C9E|nr:hypothetical protein [Kineosporia sp. NBRC 101731]
MAPYEIEEVQASSFEDWIREVLVSSKLLHEQWNASENDTHPLKILALASLEALDRFCEIADPGLLVTLPERQMLAAIKINPEKEVGSLASHPSSMHTPQLAIINLALDEISPTAEDDKILLWTLYLCRALKSLTPNRRTQYAFSVSVAVKGDPLSVARGQDLNDQCQRIIEMAETLARPEEIRLLSTLAEAKEAARDAKRAAGDSGLAGMAEYFQKFAGEERKRAFKWHAAAVVLVLAVTIFGIWEILARPDEGSWTSALHKYFIFAPLVALAFYFARQGSRHTNASSESAKIEVRLNTIRAYTAEMTPAERARLLATFGETLFRSEPLESKAAPTESEVDLLKMLVERLVPDGK